MCVPKFPFYSVTESGRAFQMMLLVSHGISPYIDGAKSEAQATLQTNLGTDMRAPMENIL